MNKRIIFSIVCLGIGIATLFFPWIKTEESSVSGIEMINHAFNNQDYATLIVFFIIAVCFVCPMLLGNIKQAKWVNLFFIFVGISGVLCVVDNTAQSLVHETQQLFYRGMGNYLLLVLFFVLLFNFLKLPIMNLLEKSKLIKLVELSDR